MTNNRRQRRAEAQKAVATRNNKVAARAANKRRAARPENKTEAQEINRMRARRNFNIPDDPTVLERAMDTVKQYVDAFVQKSPPTYLAVVAHLVLCLAAVALSSWMRTESPATAVSTLLAHRDNSSLAIAAWDLMQLDG